MSQIVQCDRCRTTIDPEAGPLGGGMRATQAATKAALEAGWQVHSWNGGEDLCPACLGAEERLTIATRFTREVVRQVLAYHKGDEGAASTTLQVMTISGFATLGEYLHYSGGMDVRGQGLSLGDKVRIDETTDGVDVPATVTGIAGQEVEVSYWAGRAYRTIPVQASRLRKET